MISVRQLRSWINIIGDDEDIYIDDGGLSLVLNSKRGEDVYLVAKEHGASCELTVDEFMDYNRVLRYALEKCQDEE